MVTLADVCINHVKARRSQINSGMLDKVLSMNMASDEWETTIKALDPDSRQHAEQQLQGLMLAESHRIAAASQPTEPDKSTVAEKRNV